jgi:hypothetical protein
MAVAIVYRPPAMTAEQYITSWGGGERPPVPIPAGLLFHAGVREGDALPVGVWI